jgi:hypothetical protein
MSAVTECIDAPMEISRARLYVLRGVYLFLTLGLAGLVGARLVSPPPNVSHMTGVVWSLLGGIGLLAAIGVRHPLKMLPVLFLELVWKVIWLAVFGIPLWRNGQLAGAHAETFMETAFGVVFVLVVMPWRYAIKHYLWTRASTPQPNQESL